MSAPSNRHQAGSAGSDGIVEVSRAYRSSIESAFEAWTRPDQIEAWFGPPGYRAQILTHELRVGGRWRFRMIGPDGASFHHFGEFVVIEPPRILAFTWASEEQIEGWRDENGDPTLVTVAFLPHDTGVEVRITHERLAAETARNALVGGWGGSLECLAPAIERSVGPGAADTPPDGREHP